MTLVQSVIKNTKKITDFFSTKTVSLMFSILVTTGRKNYASLSRSSNNPYSRLYTKTKHETQDCIEHLEKSLINIVNKHATKRLAKKLIVDFTLIEKMFSKKIENVTYDRDGSIKQVIKGLSLGFAAWSNGKITIPLMFKNWLRMIDANGLYKKKSDIVKEMINELELKVPFDEVLIDGAFSSFEMLEFFIIKKLNFTARIPSNRVIETSDGTKAQLKYHPKLQLTKNEKYKTVRATFKNIPLLFTTHKRKGKHNKKEIVFIVSNMRLFPKSYVKNYSIRNNIEKFFRTSKQSLGLGDCQSINAQKQQLHIYLVMFTYANIELARFFKKKKNVESILHIFRRQKSTPIYYEYVDLFKTLAT